MFAKTVAALGFQAPDSCWPRPALCRSALAACHSAPDLMAVSTSRCPWASRSRKSRQKRSASFRPSTVALISFPTSGRLPWSRAVSASSVADEYAPASIAQESMRPQWPLPSRNGWMAPCAKYAAAPRASNARDSSATRANRRSTSAGISSGAAVCAPGSSGAASKALRGACARRGSTSSTGATLRQREISFARAERPIWRMATRRRRAVFPLVGCRSTQAMSLCDWPPRLRCHSSLAWMRRGMGA